MSSWCHEVLLLSTTSVDMRVFGYSRRFRNLRFSSILTESNFIISVANFENYEKWCLLSKIIPKIIKLTFLISICNFDFSHAEDCTEEDNILKEQCVSSKTMGFVYIWSCCWKWTGRHWYLLYPELLSDSSRWSWQINSFWWWDRRLWVATMSKSMKVAINLRRSGSWVKCKTSRWNNFYVCHHMLNKQKNFILRMIITHSS